MMTEHTARVSSLPPKKVLGLKPPA
jgi:hypothetical protein